MQNASTILRGIATGFLALGLYATAVDALADNFLVNDPGYSHDKLLGDGVCADINNVCTLNAAIEEGNFRSGSHIITFAPTVLQITLTNSLQQLRAPFTITGNLPLRTIINGAGTWNCVDLTDSGDIPTGHFNTGADGSIIQNLVIQNCNSDGLTANGHGYTFTNNYIGTNALGTGSTVLEANKGHGISIGASRVYSNETNNFLQNLFASFPVQPLSSVDISTFASQLVTIMANGLLGPITITNNVISGNTQNGIEITSENLAATFVSNNMIGTDFTGNVAVPNGASGVHFVGSPFGNLIGPGNVISGNTVNGIQNDAGAVSLPNFVMGNRIGISATLPGVHIGNGQSGITVDSNPDSTPGHINPSQIAMIIGPANVISDNQGANNNLFPDQLGTNAGIIVTGNSDGVKILGNTIGLVEFPPGTPLSSTLYGNAGDGIIVTKSGVNIGGSAAGSGNIIAGNARHGVVIQGSSTNGTNVLGNSIGIHPGLPNDLTLGNGVDGIHIDAASTSFIGGPGATDFNTIAANGRNGVKIRNGGFINGWANLLQRNLIYSNALHTAGVGIDLDNVENAANPLHPEIPFNYANLDQAQPAICTGALGEPAACSGFQAAGDAGGTTQVDWTLQTHGAGTLPTTYRVEFFMVNAASVNAATSMTFLGDQTVTADLLGVINCPGGRCSSTIPAPSAGGYIVMTATDVTVIPDTLGGGWLAAVKCIVFSSCNVNDTSEFSNVVQAAIIPVNTTTAVTIVQPQGSGNVTPVANSVNGQPVTVTAAVTAASGALAPTGSVTITAGASSCNAVLGSPASLTATGSCVLAPAPVVAGSIYTITAAYTATPQYNASASSGGGNGSLTVAKAATTTAITAHTPDPSNVNAPIAVTAGVIVTAPGAGIPTGTITVTDSVVNCVITLPATSCNLAPTSPGAKTLTATYSGDASLLTSLSPGVSHTVSAVVAIATTTVVSLVSPSSSVFGQTVGVTASVTAASGGTAPTGSVTINAGGSSCVVALGSPVVLTSTGSCNLAPALAPSGVAYTVTAAYSGAATFAASSSSGGGNGSLTVNKAATTTVISGHTPSPSNVNAPILVTAGVTINAPGAGTLTGSITVSDGTVNCVITLPATTCNLTPTTSGAKTLTATYSGDANFNSSVSAGVSHTVNSGGAVVTTTVITLVSPSTSVFGQPVAVTASVTAGSGGAAPDGNITINAGGSSCVVALGLPVALTSKGTCSLAPALAVSGVAYPVSATYPGTATFAASNSSGAGNGSLTVNKAATTTAITGHTPNPSIMNAAILVTASVTVTAPGAGTPSGTITVSDGTVNCVITLPATTCNLIPTTAGAKTLTATYTGDASFTGGVSVGISHTVNPTPTTTAVTLVSPATAVFGQGVAVTASVTAASGANAPTGNVTINAGGSSCVAALGSPVVLTATATCTLTPPLASALSAYAVSASFAGSANFAASASSGAGNGSVTVNKAATTSSISSHTPNPSVVSAPIAVTASVVVTAPGAGTPSGTITVSDGTASCLITLPATVCNLTPTTVGAKTLTATYAGDPNFAGSASAGTPHTVSPLLNFSGPTVTPGVTGTVTLSGGSASCTLVNPTFIPVLPLVPPAGVSFPFGLFDFSASGCGAGSTINIQIVYNQALPSNTQYWKFGPTPADSNPHWYVMPGSSVNGSIVTFSITDGQIGDDDLSANGTIVDQGGPGAQPLQIPALDDLLQVMLALGLLLLGWVALRRRTP